MRTRIARTITFGHDGNAVEHQLYGWCIGESGFTWTLGAESGLAIPLLDAPHGFYVEATIFPRTRSVGPLFQRMTVVVNGSQIGSVELRQPTIAAFYVPPIREFDKQVVLTIQHPDYFSDPLGSRDFALAFTSIRILALEEPRFEKTKHFSPPALPAWDEPIASLTEAVSSYSGMGIAEFLCEFELLVGDCEFGGVQRLLGAEPLSLLRFAGPSPGAALKGLDTEFAGIGETLEPFIADSGINEWMIRDLTYGMAYHTHMSAATVSMANVLEAERRKVKFLRRKFLEDLQDRGKIYLCADRSNLPLEAMFPLFLALNRHGPQSMLWITPTDDTEMVGRVQLLCPGLMHGYIDRFMGRGVGTEPSMRGWLALLLNAWLVSRHPHSRSSC